MSALWSLVVVFGAVIRDSPLRCARVFVRSASRHPIVAEQLGVPEHEILSDSSFLKDLAADSLDIVELIMEFDEEFG